MTLLRGVREFVVPSSIVASTEADLRNCGREGAEVFIFWSGVIHEQRFLARTAHRPRQRCFRSEDGMSVVIDGDAIHEQSVWLAEHSELLGMQVHAHPDDSYHSDADSRHAVVTLTGAVSIVVPEFGEPALLGPASRIYRLGDQGWTELAGATRTQLVRVSA